MSPKRMHTMNTGEHFCYSAKLYKLYRFVAKVAPALASGGRYAPESSVGPGLPAPLTPLKMKAGCKTASPRAKDEREALVVELRSGGHYSVSKEGSSVVEFRLAMPTPIDPRIGGGAKKPVEEGELGKWTIVERAGKFEVPLVEDAKLGHMRGDRNTWRSDVDHGIQVVRQQIRRLEDCLSKPGIYLSIESPLTFPSATLPLWYSCQHMKPPYSSIRPMNECRYSAALLSK